MNNKKPNSLKNVGIRT